jgi:hypothetical protein
VSKPEIDIDALIRAKREPSKKPFEAIVKKYRDAGISDAEIVAAMAASRLVIGPRRQKTRRPRA